MGTLDNSSVLAQDEWAYSVVSSRTESNSPALGTSRTAAHRGVVPTTAKILLAVSVLVSISRKRDVYVRQADKHLYSRS